MPVRGEPDFSLKWSKNPIFLLGVFLTENEEQNYTLNFAGKIGQIKLLSNIWLQRNLSLI